ncbi:hypothetical protein C2U70_07065 [Bradyrhizobium guangdongense]|uniref:hypothetical protein n=1 Tax=Bradyrhizobium guangdongense TaxID=1325090 RepID=UPI001127C303|nr:hypothetical protein [Bradyrhizobium guangdongense]TPQ39536.1 hypothetical protein C2U70_07065 [Bradyrhizobium guangdongense]
MGLFVLDVVLWLTGIRGHIPRFDDFQPVPAVPVSASTRLIRALAAMVAVFAVLSFAVWATVWFAISLF